MRKLLILLPILLVLVGSLATGVVADGHHNDNGQNNQQNNHDNNDNHNSNDHHDSDNNKHDDHTYVTPTPAMDCDGDYDTSNSEGECVTPTPTPALDCDGDTDGTNPNDDDEDCVTPTPTVTPTVTPTATPTPTVTSTPTATPSNSSGGSNSGGPGDGLGCAVHDCSGNQVGGPASSGQVLGASTGPEQAVLGASTFGGTGTFEDTVMNFMLVAGMIVLSLGGLSYAKEKSK